MIVTISKLLLLPGLFDQAHSLASFLVTVRFSGAWAPQTSLQSLRCDISVRAPTEWPTVLGQASGFSFPPDGTRGSRETSPCDAALAWKRGNDVLSPPDAICLGLFGTGHASPRTASAELHLGVLGFSQRCLDHEWFFSGRGGGPSEARLTCPSWRHNSPGSY